MSAATPADLDAILATVREVEQTIERRAQRAMGAVMVAWGLAASSIFAFYAWAHAMPGREEGLVQWAWVAPSALAYAITVAVGARLGRIGEREGARGMRWLMLALLPPFAVVVYTSVTGTGAEYVSGMWILFLAVVHQFWCRTQEPPLRRVFQVAAAASAALGLALLVHPLGTWGEVVASAWYLLVLAGLGAVKYHLAR